MAPCGKACNPCKQEFDSVNVAKVLQLWGWCVYTRWLGWATTKPRGRGGRDVRDKATCVGVRTHGKDTNVTLPWSVMSVVYVSIVTYPLPQLTMGLP